MNKTITMTRMTNAIKQIHESINNLKIIQDPNWSKVYFLI